MKIFRNLINQFIGRANISGQKNIIGENIIFKNKHKNMPCFIIGNGSSLSKQNIKPLSKEITFVMNAFWKHPIISSNWQPTYYCFADLIYFQSAKPLVDFFTSLNRKITKSIFFVPFPAQKIVKKQKLLPTAKTYYVSFGGENIDMCKSMPSVQSTSQLAIEVAIYMGCNPIYLLGMDHDWLSHRGIDRHFYPDEAIKGHPQIDSNLAHYSYKYELECVLRLWQRYEFLLEYAKKRNIRILNVTEGGFLDIFERGKYEDIFNNN